MKVAYWGSAMVVFCKSYPAVVGNVTFYRGIMIEPVMMIQKALFTCDYNIYYRVVHYKVSFIFVENDLLFWSLFDCKQLSPWTMLCEKNYTTVYFNRQIQQDAFKMLFSSVQGLLNCNFFKKYGSIVGLSHISLSFCCQPWREATLFLTGLVKPGCFILRFNTSVFIQIPFVGNYFEKMHYTINSNSC